MGGYLGDLPLGDDFLDTLLKSFAALHEPINVEFKVLKLEVLSHESVMVDILCRVTERLRELVEEAVLNQPNRFLLLLAHALLCNQVESSERSPHELAGDQRA